MPIRKRQKQYEVEAVLDKKVFSEETRYLIKWKGYHEQTWEPEKNLKQIRDMIKEFNKSIGQNQKKTQKDDKLIKKKMKLIQKEVVQKRTHQQIQSISNKKDQEVDQDKKKNDSQKDSLSESDSIMIIKVNEPSTMTQLTNSTQQESKIEQSQQKKNEIKKLDTKIIFGRLKKLEYANDFKMSNQLTQTPIVNKQNQSTQTNSFKDSNLDIKKRNTDLDYFKFDQQKQQILEKVLELEVMEQKEQTCQNMSEIISNKFQKIYDQYSSLQLYRGMNNALKIKQILNEHKKDGKLYFNVKFYNDYTCFLSEQFMEAFYKDLLYEHYKKKLLD